MVRSAPVSAISSGRFGRALALTAAAVAGLAGFSPAKAGDMFVSAGGATSRVNVQSMAERKFATVIRQQFDFSCGSAALATLLTHHYGRKISETDAFRAMWEIGDQARIREVGFSLLEMKKYVESIGLNADGFRLTLARVAEIGIPGIALIDDEGYKHFVVIKGVAAGRVLIGDPAKGIIAMPYKKFEKVWDGTVFFVRSDIETGKQAFNHTKDWKLTPVSPRGGSLDAEPLQSVLLAQTRATFSGFAILSTATIAQ